MSYSNPALAAGLRRTAAGDLQCRIGLQHVDVIVEDGLTLSLLLMLERAALVPASIASGSWHWSYPGQEPHARIRYVGNMVDLDAATVTLDYQVNEQPVRYPVRLVWTVPRFGGRRWWFQCPLSRKDGGPPRRVANLHLPPGGRYFGSRDAYGLTYRSSQECGARRGLFRRLAAEMGTDEATIRRALRR